MSLPSPSAPSSAPGVTAARSPGERCVAHPARPAVDRCPACGRARCGADTALGKACAVCHGGRPTAQARPLPPREVVVRGALGAAAVSYVGGLVLAEYVSSPSYLKYLAPLAVGMAVASASAAAAGEPRGRLRTWVRGLSALYAVLGAAFGFVLEGTYDVLTWRADVVLPYVIAGAAAWLWAAPPRKRRPKA